ncbi:unnamed protein product [Choristocarpus tenellus]
MVRVIVIQVVVEEILTNKANRMIKGGKIHAHLDHTSKQQLKGKPRIDTTIGRGQVEPHATEQDKTRGRPNKNRPQEVPSNRPVGRFREVVKVTHQKSRDPRFEGGGSVSKLNYDIFRKSYSFLDDYQDKEIVELKKSLKKEKNQENAGRIREVLNRLQQDRAERSQGDRCQTALREAKRAERDAVASGKKPYFLKGSEKKRINLDQRFSALKEEGKLKKFLEKKRKRNASKDHRWLPSKRRERYEGTTDV